MAFPLLQQILPLAIAFDSILMAFPAAASDLAASDRVWFDFPIAVDSIRMVVHATGSDLAASGCV